MTVMLVLWCFLSFLHIDSKNLHSPLCMEKSSSEKALLLCSTEDSHTKRKSYKFETAFWIKDGSVYFWLNYAFDLHVSYKDGCESVMTFWDIIHKLGPVQTKCAVMHRSVCKSFTQNFFVSCFCDIQYLNLT